MKTAIERYEFKPELRLKVFPDTWRCAAPGIAGATFLQNAVDIGAKEFGLRSTIEIGPQIVA